MQLPNTLLEAVRHFSNLDVCNEYLASIKWPGGKPICPACGGDRVGYLVARKKLKCNSKACQKQFSYKVDTIFEDSPLGLDKWLVAVWYVATEAKVSSTLLAAMIGVTQKTAWRMIHVIQLWSGNQEWNEFDKLAKRLVKVPKEKVDRKMATDKQRRLKKKK